MCKSLCVISLGIDLAAFLFLFRLDVRVPTFSLISPNLAGPRVLARVSSWTNHFIDINTDYNSMRLNQPNITVYNLAWPSWGFEIHLRLIVAGLFQICKVDFLQWSTRIVSTHFHSPLNVLRDPRPVNLFGSCLTEMLFSIYVAHLHMSCVPVLLYMLHIKSRL